MALKFALMVYCGVIFAIRDHLLLCGVQLMIVEKIEVTKLIEEVLVHSLYANEVLYFHPSQV